MLWTGRVEDVEVRHCTWQERYIGTFPGCEGEAISLVRNGNNHRYAPGCARGAGLSIDMVAMGTDICHLEVICNAVSRIDEGIERPGYISVVGLIVVIASRGDRACAVGKIVDCQHQLVGVRRSVISRCI